jgi:hypothetical protein
LVRALNCAANRAPGSGKTVNAVTVQSRSPNLGVGATLQEFFAGAREHATRIPYGWAWVLLTEQGCAYECFYLPETRELCLLVHPIQVEPEYPSSMVAGTMQSLFNLRQRRKTSELAWVIWDDISQIEVEKALLGWETIVLKPDSLLWLLSRFSA